MEHKYQHYALDENQNLVNIKEAVKNQKYFCPSCKSEMILKQGNIRKHHFAHKIENCSYDKYLHSIAELMIANWFKNSDKINLSISCYDKCNKYKDCAIFNEYFCTKLNYQTHNLKTYYKECKTEYKYNNFIADIFCEHTKSPIFIEIYVTHECSQEKKNSGIKIIEIKIDSEEDILNIINSQELQESEKIKLYNFRCGENLTNKFSRNIQKFIIYKSGKCYIEKQLNCKNYNDTRKGVYEISTVYDDCIPYFLNSGGFYNIGKAMAYKNGYLKRDCLLCKWQNRDSFDDAFCILYKKCGNPKYCNDNNALECSMFEIDKNKLKEVIDEFNQHTQTEWVDIYKKRV